MKHTILYIGEKLCAADLWGKKGTIESTPDTFSWP